MTASREKLVVMLYDAGLRQLDRARQALEEGSPAVAGESLGRTYSIVAELRQALDHEAGGEVAGRLDALYQFVQERITAANRQRDAGPVSEAARIMRELKEGWDGVLQGT